MEARIASAVLLTAVLASFGAGYRTPNFVIEASNEGLAQRVGLAAEKYRRELAIAWLGKEMPDWNEPCPIKVQVAPHLGAGGETSFVFDRGEVFGWRMRVQGTEERVLDSVLPHEVTHTVLATHFRRPLPRWADEGACTTVEHVTERNKQQNLLITFLRTNKGIAFSSMFAMKEYPPDMLPLYAQGYSLARYLIEQGGRRKFLAYVGDGLKRENWPAATKTHYGYTTLAQLQDSWLEWVKKGSPALDTPGQQNPIQLAKDSRSSKTKASAKNDAVPLAQARFQSDDGAGRTRGATSAFEKKAGWNARDAFGRDNDAISDQVAFDDRAASHAIRSNKQSVYDREIEPSGNAHQYPFRASAQRRTAGADLSGRSTAGGPNGAGRSDSHIGMVASASQRKVILEWSRDGGHDRRGGEPLVDASW